MQDPIIWSASSLTSDKTQSRTTYRTWEITTVDEHSAGIYVCRKPRPFGSVLRPNTRRKPKLTVVHQFDSFRIVFDFHNWNNRTECFLGHDYHGMVHIYEQCWLDKITFRWRRSERFVLWRHIYGTFF